MKDTHHGLEGHDGTGPSVLSLHRSILLRAIVLPEIMGVLNMAEFIEMNWYIDLHVHSRRYSPCAESLDPLDLPAVLAQRHLNGIVITEHDRLWKKRDIKALNRDLKYGRIYRGVEVSSRNGHFIIIGLEHMDDIQSGISARTLIQKARSQSAAVILAHPQIHYRHTTCQLDAREMPVGIDAVEVASSVTIGPAAAQAEAFASQMGCASVGGSDAHSPSQVGLAFTAFSRLPANERELAAAIRSGCCIPGRNTMHADDKRSARSIATI